MAMWRAGWGWFKTLRSRRPHVRHDRADMGIEFALDASLESRLPPLMEFAALRQLDQADTQRPLGTDQRSRVA